jgi:hypothetical protein
MTHEAALMANRVQVEGFPPVEKVVTPVTAAPLPAAATRQQRPDLCYTASQAELRKHPECDVKS